MVDIFEEVDEALSRDKYQELLRKYGPWALGGALAIIVGTVAWQGFDAWQTSGREAASDSYAAAMTQVEAGQLPLAAASLETLAGQGTAGYVPLALIQRGNVALEQGDNAAAADFFEQAAAAASDPLLGDMAEIRAVWAAWDTLSFSDIDLRLSRLVNGESPFRHLARETIASAALRADNYERARTQYQFLAFANDAPAGVSARAREALALIAQRAGPAEPSADDVPADTMAADDAPVDDAAAADDAVAEETAAETEETPDAGDAGND
ncbi:tetratricopeptide repeat protein [Maricaulis sp.]|uniref:tetratricopeptide repeat protein n=1 Tax=Maricaulis sp. TaxID=1486257 RepID=UPI00260B2319|nr:tetratricopeptide repeat protein [Maricaulis sp.]MDF1767438.1 tetratricopeptide repeat protein [Maricaulis sp.]